ncbi:MAG: CDP-6-deoxy-delta-3,4-glucoseen reductase [Pseudomonadota bacterium]
MSFTVTVMPSGHSFPVERDEPILMAAIRQGVGLPYGCKDGACGSCKSRLKEGRVIHGAHQVKALTNAEEEAGWVLTCRAAPQTDVIIEARSLLNTADFPVRKMPARVHSIDKPAPDVAILRLQLPTNEQWRYRAGQYVEFILPTGQRRSYSMANAPHRQLALLGSGHPGIELHLRHLPGGVFTDQVFSRLKVRDILRLEGPYGSFHWQADSAKPIVLLASGTGFAPIKAIIEEMRAKRSLQPVALYWGCRSRVDLYLHEWAQAVAAEWPLLRYEPVLSEPRPADAWLGRTGWVHHAVMHDLPDLSQHEVYACGAPVMVAAAQADLVQRCGLPAEAFHADPFTSAADNSSAG